MNNRSILFRRYDLLESMRFDQEHRYKGVVNGLFTIDELKNDFKELGHRKWDRSLPTIGEDFYWDPELGDKSFTYNLVNKLDLAQATTIRSDRSSDWNANYALCIVKEYILSGVFILAGGMVSWALRKGFGMGLYERDFDLFIVGRNEEQAEKNIKSFYDKIKTTSPDDFNMIVTENCVTIVNSKTKLTIQIILRLYNSISEILHGFDIGACQVAWDGINIHFTAMGRVAFEQGIIVLNLTKRRNSYEYRLTKYFNYGFAVVLPNLYILSQDEFLNNLYSNSDKTAYKYKHKKHKIINAEFRLNLPNGISIQREYSSTLHTVYKDADNWYEYGKCVCKNLSNRCKNCGVFTINNILKESSIKYSGTRIKDKDYQVINEVNDYGGLIYSNLGSINTINFKKLLNNKSSENEFFYYRSPKGNVRKTKIIFDSDTIRENLTKNIHKRIENNTLTPKILYNTIPSLRDWKVEVLTELLDIFETDADEKNKKTCASIIIDKVITKTENIMKQRKNNGTMTMEIKWKGVEDDTSIVNPFIMNIISEQEWYGKWHAMEDDRVSVQEMYGKNINNKFSDDYINQDNIPIPDVTDDMFHLIKPKIEDHIATIIDESIINKMSDIVLSRVSDRICDLVSDQVQEFLAGSSSDYD